MALVIKKESIDLAGLECVVIVERVRIYGLSAKITDKYINIKRFEMVQ